MPQPLDTFGVTHGCDADDPNPTHTRLAWPRLASWPCAAPSLPRTSSRRRTPPARSARRSWWPDTPGPRAPSSSTPACRSPTWRRRSTARCSPAGYTFGLAGKLAMVTAAVPYGWGDISGRVYEDAQTVTRSGLTDSRIKLSVNLVGNPAMRARDFAKAPRKTIVGTSLTVVAPDGQYYPAKLINLGHQPVGVQARDRRGGPEREMGHRRATWASGCSPTTTTSTQAASGVRRTRWSRCRAI